jgi:multidrug resistance protein, MATE family
MPGSSPLDADLITPVPQGLQPDNCDQRTKIEDVPSSVVRDENAVSDESNASHLPGQDSSHQLRIPSIGEDQIRPSAPRWNEPTETSALLGHENASSRAATFKQWGDHVAEGKSETTSKYELLLLIRTSSPLIITCLLQYTLTGASVLAVGHLGRNELGAVSLASMTSNITGYVIYEGLSTGLDTLCAQAYGSGKLHLVGLHLQRMIYFLWLVTIPIAAIWLSSTQLLLLVIPEKECARLAGLYLKVLLLGAPGFAAFEAGKRFVQAQGLFSANLYVLLFCAPLNAFMNWLFVWVCG